MSEELKNAPNGFEDHCRVWTKFAGDFSIEGTAMVTDVPITYLGYVNRDTGVVEEPGHPLDGRAIENTILIYPKGSGSTVAPYVLMGLLYENKGPSQSSTEMYALSHPACSS